MDQAAALVWPNHRKGQQGKQHWGRGKPAFSQELLRWWFLLLFLQIYFSPVWEL
jgi:hypothetical protein